MTAAALVPRPDLEEALLEGAAGAAPVLLAGPRGAGKTTLLQQAAVRLRERGWQPIYLDLMGAASTPDRLVRSALAVIAPGRVVPALDHLRGLAARGRSHDEEAVRALFTLWQGLDMLDGRPVALLLDDVTEIRSLAYFPGLREVHVAFADALRARRRGTLLATPSPRAASRLWPDWPPLDARPFAVRDLVACGLSPEDAGLLVRASLGIARYLRILLDERAAGRDVLASWTAGMALGGRLEQAARHTYEALLLRSRGYGMSKAVLATVAEEEGLNLTALVTRLDRSPGAVRDYLGWLLAVDALRFEGKRYYHADGLVRSWLRLHGRGTLPSDEDIAREAMEVLGQASPEIAAVEPPVPPPAASAAAGRDQRLMEMD